MKNKKIVLFIVLIFIILILPKKVYAALDIKRQIIVTSSRSVAYYTGREVEIPFEFYTKDNIMLIEGKDFKVVFPEGQTKSDVGKKTPTIVGINNYEGSFEIEYTVRGSIGADEVTVSDEEWNGGVVIPKYTVNFYGKKLVEGTDYEVQSYYNNAQVGKASITIVGKGLYDGGTSKSFNIKPSKLKNLSGTIKDNRPVLTWQIDKNIDGYIVYRSETKNGTYKKLVTISKNTYDGYIDSNAKSGKKYFYKVKTYKKVNNIEYTSSFVGPVEVSYMKKTNLSIQSYKNKAKLSWNKVDNATGYKIYRANSKNGEYKEIKNIKGNKTFTWTNKNLKKYSQYYYYIKVYTKASDRNMYSEASNKVEKTSLEKVNIKSAKYSSKKNKVKWSKMSGISGYEVFRATSKNGAYSKIKTIKKKSTTSFTDKNISLGKVYYYKIRAYKNKNGKKVYGQYSSKKSVATGSRRQQMNKIKINPDQDFKNSSYGSYFEFYEKLIDKNTNSKMSTYDKVKTMYKYLVNHVYHKNGYHCKHYAGTFAGICRTIGLDAYCATGYTKAGKGWTGHTWTVIKINGTEYIFDASLERHNSDNKKNKKSVDYKYFFKKKSELKGVYKQEGYENLWPYFMLGKYSTL